MGSGMIWDLVSIDKNDLEKGGRFKEENFKRTNLELFFTVVEDLKNSIVLKNMGNKII